MSLFFNYSFRDQYCIDCAGPPVRVRIEKFHSRCARVRRKTLETVPKERVCTYLFYINIFENLKSFILSHIKFSLHVKFPSKIFVA